MLVRLKLRVSFAEALVPTGVFVSVSLGVLVPGGLPLIWGALAPPISGWYKPSFLSSWNLFWDSTDSSEVGNLPDSIACIPSSAVRTPSSINLL